METELANIGQIGETIPSWFLPCQDPGR